MIPGTNPSKKIYNKEKSMKISSTDVPIQASTCLKSKEKLQVRIDASSLSIRIKNTNNSQNPISPRSASPNPGAKELEKNLSLKPLRSPMKKNSGTGLHHTVNLSRTTCSTAIKDAKNPNSSDEPKMKLCTYSYCSLHNPKQESTLPAVKCFLRTKRQSYEAQNRVNEKNKSSRSKNAPNKVVDNLFIDTKGAEKSPDEVEIAAIVGRINGMMLEDCENSNQLQESYSVTSFEDYDDDKNSEISMDEIDVFDDRVHYTDEGKQQGEHLEIERPCPLNSSQKFNDFFCETKVINSLSTCKQAEPDSNTFTENEEKECQEFSNGSLQSRVDIPNSPKLEVRWDDEHDMKAKMANSGLCEPSKHEYNHESQLNFTRKSDTEEEISDELACEKGKVANFTTLILENPLLELTNRPKAKYNSPVRRMPTENHENAREFNPRAPPRFLPPKMEAEAEKVNLKHQPTEERKTAEEWMIDYALRQTLRRLAPARKRKVSLLVAAFESVIQQELKMS